MKHIEVVKSLMKNEQQVSKELEDYKKALMDKNKLISEMVNKQNDLIQTIEQRDEEINQLR